MSHGLKILEIKKLRGIIFLLIFFILLAFANLHSVFAEKMLLTPATVIVEPPNPPGVPTLTYPSSTTLMTDYSPTLKWSKPTVPLGTTFGHYQVQLATDSLFTVILQDANISDYYTPRYTASPDLNPNMKIYWRVQACNSLSQCSQWSATRNFRTAILPPILSSPGDGSTAASLRPTFDWMDVTGASGYTIQVSKDSSFSVIVLAADITGGTTSMYTPTSSLPTNLTLFWRVKASGVNGPSLWSVRGTFLTPNPPGIPSLTYPANNGLVTDYSPTLKWSKPTVPTGTTFDHYQIQLATNAAFSAILQETTITDYNSPKYTATPDLNPNMKIYWRVRACNSLSYCSVWSTTRNFRTAILSPILSSPDEGITVSTLRPTFDWTDVTGASGYSIQISKDSSFMVIVQAADITGGTNSTYTSLSSLPTNLTLYWRVKANGANGPSLWTNSRVFLTPNPPGVPTLTYPASNALITDYSPTLKWSKPVVPTGTTFDHYQLQLSTDSVFTAILQEVSIPDYYTSNFTVSPDLESNQKIYWRVCACNSTGHCSVWSTKKNYRTAILPPVLISPAGGSTVSSLKPTFDWEDTIGASSYTIQIAKDSAFSSITLTSDISGGTNSTYLVTNNLPIGTYYWRIKAKGVNGPSLWSAVNSFMTPNPPGIPLLVSPASNVLFTEYNPKLQWSKPVVPSGTTFDHYQIQLAADSVFSNIVQNASVADYNTPEYIVSPDLSPNLKIYWRVQACNTQGHCSSWSTTRNFRTAILPPTLVAPEEGVITTDRRPTFDWEDVTGANGYTFQVSNSPEFTSSLVDVTVVPSTYSLITDLPIGTFYWRVRANGTNGPSLWSANHSFIREPTPGFTYYVSTTGSDANPGTRDAPWATIKNATDTMVAGDKVLVLAGTYNEKVNVTNSEIVLEADGKVITKKILVSGNFNTIIGFTIADSSSSAGIEVTGNNNIIEGNEIFHTSQDGIWFFGSNNTFRGNYIHDILDPSIRDDTHVDCFQTWGRDVGATDTLFEKNICVNNRSSGKNAIVMVERLTKAEVRDLKFRNNIFIIYHPVYSSINFWWDEDQFKISNISFVSNTIVNMSKGGENAIQFVNVTNATASDNLFIGFGNKDNYIPYISVYKGINITINNNAVFNKNSIPPSGEPFPGDIWMQDPKVVDIIGLDFHLQLNSPLIDAGYNLGSLVPDDFDGITRPQGGGFDIGAFEFLPQ